MEGCPGDRRRAEPPGSPGPMDDRAHNVDPTMQQARRPLLFLMAAFGQRCSNCRRAAFGRVAVRWLNRAPTDGSWAGSRLVGFGCWTQESCRSPAAKSAVSLKLEPVTPWLDDSQWPMVYDISVGVRKDEPELLRPIETSLASSSKEVARLLRDYHIPDLREHNVSRGPTLSPRLLPHRTGPSLRHRAG